MNSDVKVRFRSYKNIMELIMYTIDIYEIDENKR